MAATTGQARSVLTGGKSKLVRRAPFTGGAPGPNLPESARRPYPTKGGYFTRGTSRNPYARYSEEGSVYVDNVQRLLRKFETAKGLVPAPIRRDAAKPTRTGVIYYGSTGAAMDEALQVMEAQGRFVNAMRVFALDLD